MSGEKRQAPAIIVPKTQAITIREDAHGQVMLYDEHEKQAILQLPPAAARDMAKMMYACADGIEGVTPQQRAGAVAASLKARGRRIA